MKYTGKSRARRRAVASVVGYAVYFICIAAVVTVVLFLYGRVQSDGEGNKGLIAGTMLGCILFLALVCTLADFLRRKFLVEKPVSAILDATGRIASGDFSVRLEPSHLYVNYNAYDEIMENINRMAAELSKTELLRTDFIANVSHEIKTPLSVIRNYAAAIRKEGLPEEERREYAETLVSAAERLSSLVTNILKLNKLENQEILPKKQPFDLSEQLRECVLSFEELLDSKNLNLDCDIDDMTVVSDASLLEIIWNNLLSNAVKFTPDGGKIGVSLKREDGYAVVRVSDTGCGMNAETGAHIFDKFYQGDTSHAQEGNGLGLALVKKVIDVLGGRISVESEVGKGSAFTVYLNGERDE